MAPQASNGASPMGAESFFRHVFDELLLMASLWALAAVSALMVGKGRGELVFTNTRGGALRGTNYRRRLFEPAVQKCQESDETFPRITPHDLRHTAASLAVSAGANVKAVQRMLGHAKASMTLDVYADLFDDDLDVVADRLDTAIIKTSTTRKTSNPITADQLRTGSENVTKNRL